MKLVELEKEKEFVHERENWRVLYKKVNTETGNQLGNQSPRLTIPCHAITDP